MFTIWKKLKSVVSLIVTIPSFPVSVIVNTIVTSLDDESSVEIRGVHAVNIFITTVPRPIVVGKTFDLSTFRPELVLTINIFHIMNIVCVSTATLDISIINRIGIIILTIPSVVLVTKLNTYVTSFAYPCIIKLRRITMIDSLAIITIPTMPSFAVIILAKLWIVRA